MSFLEQCLTVAGRIIRIAVQWGCIGHCTFEYVGDFVVCTGPSMQPTLQENDVVYCDSLVSRLMGHKVGDIVIARCVSNPNIYVCKRILGMSGDVVYSGRGYVQVPPGHCWLLGDNLHNSSDSRDYGPVPIALLRGRLIFRIYPFSKFALFT